MELANARSGTCVRGGCEQRMREANAAGADADDLLLDRAGERAARVQSGGAADELEGRVGERSRRRQRTPRHVGERGDAGADQLSQGRWQTRTAFCPRAGELEGEVGIPSRRVVNGLQNRARQRDSEALRDEQVHVLQRERTHLELLVRGKDLLRRERQHGARLGAQREQEGHVLLQPARREEQRASRCSVEPLHVVDRDENRPRLSECAQDAEEAKRDGPLVDRPARRLLEQERGPKRMRLRRRQLREARRAGRRAGRRRRRRRASPRLRAAGRRERCGLRRRPARRPPATRSSFPSRRYPTAAERAATSRRRRTSRSPQALRCVPQRPRPCDDCRARRAWLKPP